MQDVHRLPQAQHRAFHQEGYDLNSVARQRPQPAKPAMKVREVLVGQDFHGRPLTMVYFNVEEVLASMRTEATLRDHWVDRAAPQYVAVERRLCRCKGPHEPPCTKPSTDAHPHGVRTTTERAYHHCMDSKAAVDAQRRMRDYGHSTEDPKNVPCILICYMDKVHGGGHKRACNVPAFLLSSLPATRNARQASMTQWGGSFYPIYIRAGNLSHAVCTSEKAGHLWALLPVVVIDPALLGKTDPVAGDLGHAQRMEVQNACMGLLAMQLDHATRHGVRVVEEGRHICTLYPHAWATFVDRAELAGCTGTHYAYLVECACAHCLVPRSLWVEPPWQPRGWWNDRRRCRSQMLLLVDEDMPTNKSNLGPTWTCMPGPKLYHVWPKFDPSLTQV